MSARAQMLASLALCACGTRTPVTLSTAHPAATASSPATTVPTGKYSVRTTFESHEGCSVRGWHDVRRQGSLTLELLPDGHAIACGGARRNEVWLSRTHRASAPQLVEQWSYAGRWSEGESGVEIELLHSREACAARGDVAVLPLRLTCMRTVPVLELSALQGDVLACKAFRGALRDVEVVDASTERWVLLAPEPGLAVSTTDDIWGVQSLSIAAPAVRADDWAR